MASNLFGTISDRMKQMTSEKFPGLAAKTEESSSHSSSDPARPAGASFAG
jgi:hypothetical protein